MTNFTKLSFFRTFIGMVINVILNFVLIPKYGIIGAAYATLISYSLAVFSIILFPKTGKQFFMMMKSIFLITLIQYLFEKWNIHSEKK